ncbi:MAG TPA: hypothetical protein VME92_12215 [Acetobacteraceae bacterium]|nr:hypothetical protein [Acetobacteraceae bacterium]
MARGLSALLASRGAFLGLIAAFIAIPTLAYLRQVCADPLTAIADQGIDGPYEFTPMPDGDVAIGHRVAQIRAGESVAWLSRACAGDGTPVRGRIELLRLPDRYAGEQVVRQRAAALGAGGERCDPLADHIRVPADARPGQYELRRIAVVRAGLGGFRAFALNPLRFEVIPP